MAKTQTKREHELTERLHALGLRRRVARNIAHGAATVTPQLPDALKDMLGKVDERAGRKAKKAKKGKKAKKAKKTEGLDVAAAQASAGSAQADKATPAPKKKSKKKRAKRG
jgi:hypothetical protein